jgi:hypothetical protein
MAHPSRLWVKRRRERRVSQKARGYPTPRYFAKRGWKLLKTKGGRLKKRGKSVKEAANL